MPLLPDGQQTRRSRELAQLRVQEQQGTSPRPRNAARTGSRPARVVGGRASEAGRKVGAVEELEVAVQEVARRAHVALRSRALPGRGSHERAYGKRTVTTMMPGTPVPYVLLSAAHQYKITPGRRDIRSPANHRAVGALNVPRTR